MKPVLLVIAQMGYQDLELAGTRQGLAENGLGVVLASVQAGPCQGKFGGQEMAAIALKDVVVTDYDRIAFIGGPGAATLKAEPQALRVAREAFEGGLPLGAICIAPLILGAAGVLSGKRATVWEGGRGEERMELQKRGAIPTEELVTIDGNVVTGNGPDAALAFGQALAAVESTAA